MARTSLLIALLLMMGLSANAMIRTLPFPELVKKAEVIVIVQVVDQKITEEAGVTNPKVHTEVEVERVLKGAVKAKDRLAFDTQGTVKKAREDSPIFPEKGRKAVLFLVKGDGGQWRLLNGIQGLWPLHAETGKTLGMGFRYSVEQVEAEIKKN
ncbi:MAG: hypothetical protein GX442_24315 [Candidatus Riflebacteria bacterium]|nr:hypothetical protein [Candidatus Riflebacteria bacterium]